MTDRHTSAENKGKTSLRIHYEAEAKVIREKIGSIEDIRADLGLSRRKMCQLLLIDPSTWTRWTRDESKVPPQIYRTLQWYLSLIEKHPEWHPQNSFGPAIWKTQNEQVQALSKKLNDRISQLEQEKTRLESRIESGQRSMEKSQHDLNQGLGHSVQVGLGWKMLLLANTILVLFALFQKLFA